jgi:DNA-binding beta-propeller fold protein YncE
LDTLNGRLLQSWNVGFAPFEVVLAGQKIYVSNWGGRRPDADSVTGPGGDGMRVRVDDRSIASEGSVSVIQLSSNGPAKATEIITGRHACAMALSPNGRWLVVANAGEDTLTVIDTAPIKSPRPSAPAKIPPTFSGRNQTRSPLTKPVKYSTSATARKMPSRCSGLSPANRNFSV